MRQIELKVAKAQYEKVLLAIYDTQLALSQSSSVETTGEQKQVERREALKIKVLENQRAMLRTEIETLIAEANQQTAERAAQQRSKDGESK